MTFLPRHPAVSELLCIANQPAFNGNRKEAVQRILSWLVEEDIIKPENSIIRYHQNGHRFSEGIKQIVTGPLPDLTSVYVGLEFDTERQIYCFHPTFDYILCPNCKSDLESCIEHEELFEKAMMQWENHNGVDFINFPVCDEKVRFDEFQFGIECAFSDLSFTFSGCQDFTEIFQAELERRLGCPVRLLRK